MRILGEMPKEVQSSSGGGRVLGTIDQSMAGLSQSQSFVDRVRQQAQEAEMAAQQAQAPTTIAKETGKGVVSTFLDRPIKSLRSGVQAIGEMFGATPQKTEGTNFAGEPLTTYQEDLENPDSTQTVAGAAGNMALDAASVAPIGRGLSMAKQGLGKVAKPVMDAVGPVVSKVGKSVMDATGISGALAKRANKEVFDFAVDFTAPSGSKVAEEAIEQGRITTPGIFKKSRVTPTPNDNLVAESVADVVSPKSTLQQNVDSIRQKIAQTNHGVRSMILDNGIEEPVEGLANALHASKEESKLIFASDVTAEKTYNAVIDEFINLVKKSPTKQLGIVDFETGALRAGPDVVKSIDVFDARQEFDKIPAIKKLLDSSGLGENVRRQIVLDVRRAANKFVADGLPENNPYRAALLQESRMIEALGNIANKNKDTIGRNRLQLIAEEYPALKYIIGGALGAAGVGVGGAIIDSSGR